MPTVPQLLARGLHLVPRPMIQRPLERVVVAVARRHPALFARLGHFAAMTFLIDPTDLPIALRLRPRPDSPSLEVLRTPTREPSDARIAGPLAVLLDMVHGAADGDALFFSRDLAIEGSIEAILALRNALDDAEIDLLAEFAAALGPLGRLAERPARALLPVAERLTGVTLARAGRLPA
jgi:predicted lipid carrier protein YhbT